MTVLFCFSWLDVTYMLVCLLSCEKNHPNHLSVFLDSILQDLSGSIDDLTTGNDFSNSSTNSSSGGHQNLPNNTSAAPSNQSSNATAPSSQANNNTNDSYSTSSQASQSPHMQHPSVTALRPSPSPVGSPASHISRSSLSPASVQGQY